MQESSFDSLSEETLNAFLNIMPAVLYEYQQRQDGSGFLRYISPNCKDILGRPNDFFLSNSNNLWSIIHPEDIGRLKKEDEITVNDGEFKSKARIVLPSNEIRWVKIQSKPASKTKEGDVIWSGCIIDITQLINSKNEIKSLQGIIPICSYCKKIRDDKGAWEQLENYIEANSEAQFSHGICNKCLAEKFPKQNKKLDESKL